MEPKTGLSSHFWQSKKCPPSESPLVCSRFSKSRSQRRALPPSAGLGPQSHVRQPLPPQRGASDFPRGSRGLHPLPQQQREAACGDSPLPTKPPRTAQSKPVKPLCKQGRHAIRAPILKSTGWSQVRPARSVRLCGPSVHIASPCWAPATDSAQQNHHQGK